MKKHQMLKLSGSRHYQATGVEAGFVTRKGSLMYLSLVFGDLPVRLFFLTNFFLNNEKRVKLHPEWRKTIKLIQSKIVFPIYFRRVG